MPINNQGKYINPGWMNDGPPAIDAAELNAISDTLENLDAGGGSGGGGGDGKRYARFVIGTSTNGWTAEDCDYLCDGTDDQVEINTAIEALPNSGGKIQILDGEYHLSDDISTFARDSQFSVFLQGNGKGTELRFSSSSGLRVKAGQSIDVKNLHAVKAYIRTPSNIQITIKDCYLDNPTISFTFSTAILTGNSFSLSEGGTAAPISMTGGKTIQGDLYGIVFSNNIIKVADSATFPHILSASSCVVNGNVLLNNGATPIGIAALSNSSVTGNILYNCTLGFTLGSAQYSGNYVYNGNISCVSSPCTGNTVVGGSIYASEGSSVTGNTVVQESPSGEACIVIGKARNINDENALTIVSSNSCEGGTIGILLNTNSYNNRSESHATVIGNACSSSVPLQIESVWSDCLITGNMFPNGAIVDNGSGNVKANNFTGS